MYYLFINGRSDTCCMEKERLQNMIPTGTSDTYVIKEYARWVSPTDLYLDDNGNVLEREIPVNLEALKSQKLSQIDSLTAAKIIGGFTSTCTGTAVTYDSDKDTQLTMQGIALNVNSDTFAEKYPDGCPVRGYVGDDTTKSVLYLTPAQVLAWQADLSIHIGTCKQWGWSKQAEVEAAATVEEVEAIEL